jgi:hypothetical protein
MAGKVLAQIGIFPRDGGIAGSVNENWVVDSRPKNRLSLVSAQFWTVFTQIWTAIAQPYKKM